ncbi:MATE family efflux transporter [Streptosporangium sp. NPDC000396]|uniref:MATE family efflux transporter n=1 Tax=Streptosporangium sp. NPDC000396 TaxID=3366185 RepID=UPI0036B3222C
MTAISPPIRSDDVSRGIRRLAGPMLIGEATGVLVPISIVALLGRAVGDHALVLRSLYLPMELFYIAIQFAFGTSSQVIAAVSSGARREKEIGAQIMGLAVLWAVLGTVMALAVWFTAPHLADLLHVEAGAHDDFLALVRWSAICHPLMAVPVLSAATLRGTGRPGAGTTVSTVAVLLELASVAVFGVWGGWGANSIPLSFAVSGLIGGGLGVYLMRGAGLWSGDGFQLGRQVRQAFDKLTSVGLPVGLSYAILSVSNFVLLSMIGPLGPIMQAGYANALSLQTFVTVPGIVLGSATAIVMNQQRGAGREGEMGRTFLSGLRICAVVYVPMAAAMWLGRDWLAWLSTTDPGIHDETARFLAVVAPTYAILGISLLTLTAIEQTGLGLLATVLNLVYFSGTTAIGGWAARAWNDSLALYWTIAVFNLIALLVDIWVALLVQRRARKAEAGA